MIFGRFRRRLIIRLAGGKKSVVTFSGFSNQDYNVQYVALSKEEPMTISERITAATIPIRFIGALAISPVFLYIAIMIAVFGPQEAESDLKGMYNAVKNFVLNGFQEKTGD